MRLFLAVDLDESTRAAVGEVATTLRARLDPALARSAAWVAPANLHVTLRFLGETRDEAAAALCLALDQPVPLAPFEIEIGGIGAFPEAGAPRLLWMGIRRGEALLSAIYDEVQARLTELHVSPEPRPFHPHITLARFKRDRMPRSSRLPNWVREAGQPIDPMPVGELTLFESHLSPHGSTYTARLRTPLVALGGGVRGQG